MTYEGRVIAAAAGAVLAGLVLVACGSSNSPQGAVMSCSAGQVIACLCPGGQSSSMTCAPSGGVFQACACPAAGAGGAGAGTPLQSGTGGTQVGTGTGGAVSAQPGTAGAGGMGTGGIKGTGGMGGTGGMTGTGGMSGMGGMGGMSGTGGTTGTGGMGTAGSGSSPDLDMLRQLCVDTINMYRMTVGAAPLMRASATLETCSDKGAMSDGTTMQAHGSAGSCPGLGGQDTCPGWGVGGFSGNATVADALKKCLMQMWGEGMPPESRQACIMDYTNCFLKYGHYLNMSDTSYTVVSCGFFQMSNGNWWMNQDFGH